MNLDSSLCKSNEWKYVESSGGSDDDDMIRAESWKNTRRRGRMEHGKNKLFFSSFISVHFVHKCCCCRSVGVKLNEEIIIVFCLPFSHMYHTNEQAYKEFSLSLVEIVVLCAEAGINRRVMKCE